MSNSFAQKNDKVCPKRKTLIMKEKKKKKKEGLSCRYNACLSIQTSIP
jgi:hypothetical protein